jgi:hypothetical protein
VHHQPVGLQRPRLELSDVVYQENLSPTDLERVRRLEQLDANPSRRGSEQPLSIAIVPAENAADRKPRREEGRQRERCAKVASVQQHLGTLGGQAAVQLAALQMERRSAGSRPKVAGLLRDPDSFAVGAFGMYSSLSFGLAEYIVGGEAQAYLGDVTLYGQAYWGQANNLPLVFTDGSENQWGARGVVRYFVHDNLRFDGELAYNSIVEGNRLNTVTALAQANYRFDDTPFTVFSRYQFDQVSVGASSAKFHRFHIGLRVTMGADTLMAEDRYGATMDLPRHIRFLFN